MKKSLILIFILGAASLANATVIDVVTDGPGSMGHTGTSADPLEVGEMIWIKIVLNHNPYPGYPSYDGYSLDTIGLTLDVSGPATLGVVMATSKTGDYPDLGHHFEGGFEVWSQADPLIVNNGIDELLGGTLSTITGPADLVWNLYILCDDAGTIDIDLGIMSLTRYWDYEDPYDPKYGYGDSKFATESDLGDLTIYYGNPEPATILLLGLGGLMLLRKRRT